MQIDLRNESSVSEFNICMLENCPEPVLDRLPTARVVEQYEHKCTIEAEVYGKGCLMWLLSQGDKVEILRPESLREEMKNTLQKMIERYK